MSPDTDGERPTLLGMTPIKAATSVVAVPVAAVKANPIVWLVFFAILAAVIIRYRVTLLEWFAKAPGGDRVVTFAR
jgi:hypothetical protein